MYKPSINYISTELNHINLPTQDLKAFEIIKMSERERNIHNVKQGEIKKWLLAAVCLCLLFIAGSEVYASSIAQQMVRFTNNGFVIGKEQSIELNDMNNSYESSGAEGTSEVTTETPYNGENDSRFTDPEEVYQMTGMPRAFPTVIIDNFMLSEDGINYYQDISGNLTSRQWSATYLGEEKEQVYLYLDYKDYEGEKDTRYGSEYSWVSKDTKVNKQKKYISEYGITFALAKLSFTGKTYYLAVMSAGNYYYYLQFENMEKKVIYKVLDSIQFNLE